MKYKLEYSPFTFGLAVSKKIIDDTYRLRYEVYAEEFGFEKKEDFPSGMETDNYDRFSKYIACLNEHGTVVGTVRLVLSSSQGFPVEKAVNTAFIGDKPEPEKIAEISRLAISKNLRQRKDDGKYGVESYLKIKNGGNLPDDGTVPEEYRRRNRPIIVLGLYQAMYHHSKRMGISHWYMITEKKLFKALSKYGFLFHQIGDPINYHGLRIPYLGIIDEIEKDLMKNNPEMLKLMLIGLEEKYHPKMQ